MLLQTLDDMVSGAVRRKNNHLLRTAVHVVDANYSMDFRSSREAPLFPMTAPTPIIPHPRIFNWRCSISMIASYFPLVLVTVGPGMPLLAR